MAVKPTTKKKATAKKKVSTSKRKAAPKKKTTVKKAPVKKTVAAKKAASKKRATVAKKKVATKKARAKKRSPRKSKAAKSKPRTGYVSTQIELADFLNCSRATVSRYLRKPDCPETTADGKYPLVKWKEFYEKEKDDVSKDDVELVLKRKADREITEVKLEREKLELAIARGEVMNVDDVCLIVSQAWSGSVQHLRAAEHQIAPLMAGLDTAEAKAVIRKNHIDALEKFSLGEWAKKKLFWRKVYARLLDLRVTYNHGNGLSET